MTNKQTIDGVSVEQLKRGDRLFHVAKNWRCCGRGWVKFICDEGDGIVRVRHEHGAVPTVNLSNLQTQAMTPEQELSEFYEELSSGGKLATRALCHIKSLQAKIDESVQPDAQPQGEVERLREEIVRLKGWGKANQGLAQTCMEEVKATREQHAERDEALRTCEKWFAKHSPTAPLIGGFGDAEHPMLTFIRAALSTSAEPKPRGEVDGDSRAPKHRDGPVAVCRLWNEGGSGERTSVEWVKGPCADGTLLYAVTPAPNQQTDPAGEVVRVSEDQALIGLYDEYSLKVGDLVYAEPSHSGGANEMVAKPLLAKTVRRAFICKGCEGVYADEAVSSCDCMCLPEFIEGEIRY